MSALHGSVRPWPCDLKIRSHVTRATTNNIVIRYQKFSDSPLLSTRPQTDRQTDRQTKFMGVAPPTGGLHNSLTCRYNSGWICYLSSITLAAVPCHFERHNDVLAVRHMFYTVSPRVVIWCAYSAHRCPQRFSDVTSVESNYRISLRADMGIRRCAQRLPRERTVTWSAAASARQVVRGR